MYNNTTRVNKNKLGINNNNKNNIGKVNNMKIQVHTKHVVKIQRYILNNNSGINISTLKTGA